MRSLFNYYSSEHFEKRMQQLVTSWNKQISQTWLLGAILEAATRNLVLRY